MKSAKFCEFSAKWAVVLKFAKYERVIFAIKAKASFNMSELFFDKNIAIFLHSPYFTLSLHYNNKVC